MNQFLRVPRVPSTLAPKTAFSCMRSLIGASRPTDALKASPQGPCVLSIPCDAVRQKRTGATRSCQAVMQCRHKRTPALRALHSLRRICSECRVCFYGSVEFHAQSRGHGAPGRFIRDGISTDASDGAASLDASAPKNQCHPASLCSRCRVATQASQGRQYSPSRQRQPRAAAELGPEALRPKRSRDPPKRAAATSLGPGGPEVSPSADFRAAAVLSGHRMWSTLQPISRCRVSPELEVAPVTATARPSGMV